MSTSFWPLEGSESWIYIHSSLKKEGFSVDIPRGRHIEAKKEEEEEPGMVIWPTGRSQDFGHVPLQLILSIPGNTELEEKVSNYSSNLEVSTFYQQSS